MKKLFVGLVLGLVLVGVFVSAGMTLDSNGVYDVEVYVEKGWNIIAGTIPENGLALDSEIQLNDISAMYYYSPKTAEYIRAYPNAESTKLQQADDDIVLTSAMWIYVKKSGTIKYSTLEDYPELNQRQLFAGWNFVTITPDMLGKSLTELGGTCNIQKAYAWEVDGQRWENILSEELYSGAEGGGMAVKVASDCKLGSSGASPPGLPGGVPGLPEGDTENKCIDSDGGKNFEDKGYVDITRVRSYENGSTSVEENRYNDICIKDTVTDLSDSNDVSEYFCEDFVGGGAGSYNTELFTCSDGCSDGACI